MGLGLGLGFSLGLGIGIGIGLGLGLGLGLVFVLVLVLGLGLFALVGRVHLPYLHDLLVRGDDASTALVEGDIHDRQPVLVLLRLGIYRVRYINIGLEIEIEGKKYRVGNIG